MIAAAIRELARPTDGNGFHPVLIAGPDESALADQVMSELDGIAATNLAGRTGLRDLIGDFRRMRCGFRSGFRSDAYRGGRRMPDRLDLGFDRPGTFRTVGQ